MYTLKYYLQKRIPLTILPYGKRNSFLETNYPCVFVVYSYCMKTTLLNYSVIIEPDTETGTNKPGFTAYCPALGIADDGDTIEKALKNIKKTIIFHLDCLREEGEPIPAPSLQGILTNVQVSFGGTPSFV